MNTTIPALSLRPPWAWAIFHAGKTIENRTWATKYRGRIRIHAAKTWDREGANWLVEHGYRPPSSDRLRHQGQIGAYVGEVTVVDCFTLLGAYAVEERRQWAFGPVCWILEDPVAYQEPIPGRGYPGLYRPENFPPYCERRNG